MEARFDEAKGAFRGPMVAVGAAFGPECLHPLLARNGRQRAILAPWRACLGSRLSTGGDPTMIERQAAFGEPHEPPEADFLSESPLNPRPSPRWPPASLKPLPCARPTASRASGCLSATQTAKSPPKITAKSLRKAQPAVRASGAAEGCEARPKPMIRMPANSDDGACFRSSDGRVQSTRRREAGTWPIFSLTAERRGRR